MAALERSICILATHLGISKLAVTLVHSDPIRQVSLYIYEFMILHMVGDQIIMRYHRSRLNIKTKVVVEGTV